MSESKLITKRPRGPRDEILPQILKLKALHSCKQEKEGFVLLEPEGKSDSKEAKRFVASLVMLKGILFKRDQPYRTLLPLQGNFSTNSAGVLNVAQSVSNLGSVAEWSAIDALFDEVFVHSMKFRYFPLNDLGGGVGTSASSSVTGGVTAIACTNVVNGPVIMCSLFHGSPNYSSASAMAANANVAVKSSAKPWTYVWRNNERFDPRGPSGNFQSGTNITWQGWAQLSGVAYLGGQIQFRMLNDLTVGTSSAAVTLGAYLCQYDVSFRARS